MKFRSYRCPECKEIAMGSSEVVYCTAYMEFDPETREFNFIGDTEVCWDSQVNVEKDPGKMRLCCPNGHEWVAKLKEV
jgi:hypothetical protein